MRFEAIDGIEIARISRHLNSFNHSGLADPQSQLFEQ